MVVGGTGSDRSHPAWRQTYRALDHRTARKRCENQNIRQFPVEIQDLANVFVDMQKKRHGADYDPDAVFSKPEVVQQPVAKVPAAFERRCNAGFHHGLPRHPRSRDRHPRISGGLPQGPACLCRLSLVGHPKLSAKTSSLGADSAVRAVNASGSPSRPPASGRSSRWPVAAVDYDKPCRHAPTASASSRTVSEVPLTTGIPSFDT